MNQKTIKMLRKIAKIHNKNYKQLKKRWYEWDDEMQKKAKIGFKRSIAEWDRGMKRFREEVAKEKAKKEKNEAKVSKACDETRSSANTRASPSRLSGGENFSRDKIKISRSLSKLLFSDSDRFPCSKDLRA